ncbi:uncharacterized protein N7479_000055 [Penicillium vulpinum]|uniref:Uncharacterized protein n=1 Tax=Penicillium vulpinum TaxID=29845 RepID=A0A1V6RWP8_9EURO|nr:uncharacterized protein N7479_000055 [Penicillium vulpinum]KAJ5970137.1 hypothetical protein N7479_000055 [Penicillium vulpinum]OQE06197.1 hypothetical protein PENVUL_c019G05501 [Penicillium vulpinum]
MSNNASGGAGALPRQVARQLRQQSQTRGRSTGRAGASNSQNSNRRAASYTGPIQPGMGSSRYATVPDDVEGHFEPDLMELDPMEIDSPVQEPPPSTSVTRMTEESVVNHVHRHIFYIPIQSRPIPTLDLDVLTAARAELTRLQRVGLPILQVLPERAGPHVYICIETKQDNRDHALTDANLRMGTMQDMIRDGLGWFTGLPYRHPHFEVKFLRGRRL